MKPIYLFIILLLLGIDGIGQADNNTAYLDKPQACDPETIFTLVEKMPVYKGGVKKLESDLNEKFHPGKKINGNIYISFTVNCKGDAFDFQVLRGINPELEEKIIEELKQLQNWESGLQRGKLIDCKQVLAFNINKGEIKITGR